MMDLWKKYRFLAYALLWSSGAVAAFVAARMAQQSGRKQADFIKTQGKLKRAWSTVHGQGMSNNEIRIHVRYTYSVDGTQYTLLPTGTKYWSSTSSRKAAKKLAELRARKTIDVWYDPQEPRRAVTSRHAGAAANVEYGVAILAGLVGLAYLTAFFVTLFLARRRSGAA